MKAFLESNRNKFTRNEQMTVGVELESTRKLLPKSGRISSIFSLYEQYNYERDTCDKYRLIFTVNPICTNALYNVKTEVVVNEGSDKCKFLNAEDIDKPDNSINTSSDTITLEQALDDTEYSNPEMGGFVYHCGMDIFKNHRLRDRGFHFFKEPKSTENDAKKTFNTIESFLTDNEGKVVKEKLVLSAYTNQTEIPLHAYTIDNMDDFMDAYNDGVREVDGWYGFYNVGNINIPNTEIKDVGEIDVNRVINNNKQCEFIDFYPDRSLFSFIPKVNKARRRLENNWDYCLTYPYASDSGAPNEWGITDDNGGIQIVETMSGRTDGGNFTVTFRTIVPHNLAPRDYVSLYLSVNINPLKCRVVSLGDISGNDQDTVFTIKYRDIASVVPMSGDSTIQLEMISSSSFKRLSSGVECKYYARKLRKIGNYRSECNKIVGGKNIYGDKFAQIVFTDDIEIPIDEYVTNLGTPITDVYLTIVKRGAGREEFYNASADSETVEFSHCFGKVTSGVKLPKYVKDYNIYRLTNVSDVNGIVPYVIEDDVTIDNLEFYYDIVEFDPINILEKQLEVVYHRFNTYQRECQENTSHFNDPIMWKYIVADDYTPNTDGTAMSSFTVSSATIPSKDQQTDYPVNVMPEGYFYRHSYPVKVRELGNLVNCRLELLMKDPTIVDMNEYEMIDDTGYTGVTIDRLFPYAIVSDRNFNLMKGDELCFIRSDGSVYRVYFNSYEETVSGNSITGYTYLNLLSGDASILDENFRYVYRITDKCPSYALFNPKNSCLSWREITPLSELDNDSELYDMPFSNGANYRHTNINFFLQRQDPHGDYGLRDANVVSANFVPSWKERIDLSEVTFFYNNLANICF